MLKYGRCYKTGLCCIVDDIFSIVDQTSPVNPYIKFELALIYFVPAFLNNQRYWGNSSHPYFLFRVSNVRNFVDLLISVKDQKIY